MNVGLLLAIAALGAQPAAAEPRLDVSPKRLAASVHCQPEVRNARRMPVMLVTATAIPGRVAWVAGPRFQDALRRAGHPSCFVEFPDVATGDLQVAAQYLVHGLRRQARLAGRRIGVYGISLGGLVTRWALTYWPSLGGRVSDVVTVGAPHHGTTWASQSAVVDALCRPTAGCPPAFWQISLGSRFLRALNGRRDAPSHGTSWTTVRTLSDELVAPQTRPYPTSSLTGARNVLIQDVCPGRLTSHIAAFYDSVSFAALLDAVEHPGAAQPRRFPEDVCAHPFATGVDPGRTAETIAASLAEVTGRVLDAPKTKAEPPLRRYAELRK